MIIDDTTNQPTADTTVVENTPADDGVDTDLVLDDDLLSDAGLDTEQADDDVEIEYEGKRFKVPANAKDAFLRNSDYTQKTQSVAEQRRSLEAEKAFVSQMRDLHQDVVVNIGKIVSIDTELAKYQAITKEQWAELDATDPLRSQQLFRQMSLLKDERDGIVKGVQSRQEQLRVEEQRQSAKQLEENKAALKKLIPNWSPELGRKVADFAKQHIGLSDNEVASITDPRYLKTLHLARLGHQVMTKSRAATAAPTVEANPVPQVAARRSAPTTDLAKIKDPEEWRRIRQKQVDAQRRQRRG